MNPDAADNSVPREISALLSKERLILRETRRAVTPLGGLAVFVVFLSTVFERYGQQQGSLKGHNPRKHGRPSHHPLLAVLAEAHFLLHGWLRSGNCGSSRGAKEILARGPGAVGTTPKDSLGPR